MHSATRYPFLFTLADANKMRLEKHVLYQEQTHPGVNITVSGMTSTDSLSC